MTIEMTCETYASFEDDWSPDAYLADYYTEVQPDEDVTMRFLIEAAALVGDVPSLLEFGCGPTVHHLLPFVMRASEIHVVDFLERNLDAVRRWVDGRDGAWDWTPFTNFTLFHELGRQPVDFEVREREAAARERVRSFGRADARRSQPLAAGSRRYPAVLCCFCPDSMTADREEWRKCTEHVASLVAPAVGWCSPHSAAPTPTASVLAASPARTCPPTTSPTCSDRQDSPASVRRSRRLRRTTTTTMVSIA
jgi:hypothetical protein